MHGLGRAGWAGRLGPGGLGPGGQGQAGAVQLLWLVMVGLPRFLCLGLQGGEKSAMMLIFEGVSTVRNFRTGRSPAHSWPVEI